MGFVPGDLVVVVDTIYDFSDIGTGLDERNTVAVKAALYINRNEFGVIKFKSPRADAFGMVINEGAIATVIGVFSLSETPLSNSLSWIYVMVDGRLGWMTSGHLKKVDQYVPR